MYLEEVINAFDSFQSGIKIELFKKLSQDVFKKQLDSHYLEFLIEYVEEFFEAK